MLYLYLAVALVFGGLYLDDKYQRSQVKDLTGKVESAEGRVASLEQSLRDEEEKRSIDIDALAKHQDDVVRRSNATWRARLAALSEQMTRQRARLEQVHAYVSPAADARCVVPVGAVLLHDAAAGGAADEGGAAVPGPAGGSLDADSGVRLSTVVGTVAGNYVGARDVIAKLGAEVTAWREWYVAQRALFQEKP